MEYSTFIKFTHNHPHDTTLERDGNTLVFSFIVDMFTMEEQDHIEFSIPQDELFQMLGEYFDSGNKAHAEIFDQLTLPGQDALWNVLLHMNKNNITL